MRTEVLHITRNIILKAADENSAWGARIYFTQITYYYEPTQEIYVNRGIADLDGFAVINGG